MREAQRVGAPAPKFFKGQLYSRPCIFAEDWFQDISSLVDTKICSFSNPLHKMVCLHIIYPHPPVYLKSSLRLFTLLTQVLIVKAMIFPVVMYGCERWTIKKAERQRIDAFELVLEKTLENPLDSKEIQSIPPKENQPWIFIGRTDAKAPLPWCSDAKNWLIGKDPDSGKDWGQEEKGTIEDEMIGWHHWLDAHEFV